ncbi:UNVERIFIED_CONTAM: hypothetical protein H355_013675 [Colinus virginianus]|nr:hypothetical protein H355_013675 [Colinus virginianus]
MEGDKRRTKEDTWKSDELRKHLRASQPEYQNEEKKHREKKLQKEKLAHDTGIHKDELKDRGKSKERTRERLKSVERDRDKMRERGKEHHRERDREGYQDKLQESGLEKERYNVLRDKDRESNRERDKMHRTHEIKQSDMHNNLQSFEGRDKGHHRRREKSRHRLEEEKTRVEERERRHTGKKDSNTKASTDTFLADKAGESEHGHKLQKDKELDKEEKRRSREKKEHSIRPGKDGHTKERGHRSYKKEEEEKRKSKRSKEKSSHGDRGQPAKDSKRARSGENEEKKLDLRNSEHKTGEGNREERSHEHVRTGKDKGKISEEEKRDTSQEEVKGTNVYSSDRELDNCSTNYEDDFEDYEDDFDDYDEEKSEEGGTEDKLREIRFSKTSEIEEIQRAINAENDRICTSLPQKIKNEEPEPVMEKQYLPGRNSFCGIFMDFETANKRQSSRSMASKQKKRSAELLPLIDLDFSVSFSLLDLPPVNEYDMYIRNYGKMNTKQAYVQCNEDNLDRDIQTEEIETLEKWTQHPAEGALASGGPINNQEISANGAQTPNIDSQRLADFLRSAGQVRLHT